MSLQNISSAASCLQLVLHDVECFLLQMKIILSKIIFCAKSLHTKVLRQALQKPNLCQWTNSLSKNSYGYRSLAHVISHWEDSIIDLQITVYLNGSLFTDWSKNVPTLMRPGTFMCPRQGSGGELLPFVTSQTAVCFSMHFLKSKMDRSTGLYSSLGEFIAKLETYSDTKHC